METSAFHFVQLALHLPVLLVVVSGIIISIIHWQRNPKAALAALIGCTILGVETLLFTGIYMFLPTYLINKGITPTQMGFYYSTLNFISSIISAAGLGCLLAAVFCWRK